MSEPFSGAEAGGPQASQIAQVRAAAAAVRENVAKVIVGKDDVIELLLVTLLAEGHPLIEDVPGTGKTVLAKALARSLGLTFARIQGTPDVLPSDVTGTSYFNQKLGDFEFRPGPIFANVVLADEINRATPRTQASLLEAMQERQVTADRETLPLPRPFMLVATQNPVELEGTFPLPEAQLDRFFMRLRMQYPSLDDERAILYRFQQAEPLDDLRPVLGGHDLQGLFAVVRAVHVSQPVANYLLAIVRGTREHPSVQLGASPRAALALFHASQARAALMGRRFVQPDDVKRLAGPVLAHRLMVTAQSRVRGEDGDRAVAAVVAGTPVPVEQAGDGGANGSVER